MAEQNLADNEELVLEVQGEVNTLVETYKTQREDIDVLNKVADYMYACAQNRTLESSEKEKGMNMDDDTRSNVGSTLFHRIVNQLASQLEAVLWSKPMIIKYKTFSKDGVQATQDDAGRAEMANLLAKWTIKTDGFLEKVPVFSRMLFKRSNIFAQIIQVREEDEVSLKVPEFEQYQDENGEIRVRISGEKDETETKIMKNYPSIVFPDPSTIFLDNYIADIQQQHCVAIQSIKTKGELFAGVANEWYSEEQYEKLDESYLWDGETGREALEDKEAQRNSNINKEKQKNLYLVWDVYINLPMTENGELDEEEKEVPTRYWLTLVGNTIGGSLCLRFERNPEPDDEIPLQDIHVFPDDGDRMYHTTTAEIARSSYSADTTLMNLSLDNMGLINDPPKLVQEGEHSIKDWEFKKGQVWSVYNPKAVTLLDVNPFTQDTSIMREKVKEELMMAMNVDKGFVGQSQGARTSASEATFINRNSMQPHLSQIRYILMQLLPWMGKKYMSYWQEYGDPDQVLQITDENKQYRRIKPSEVDGEFDVNVEIIDEYESDLLRQQNLQNILNIVANNEWLHQSDTEQIDGPALLKEIVKSYKIDPSTFITGVTGGDVERAAREDIDLMLYEGQDVEIPDNIDIKTHLRIKEAELTKWKGVEQEAIGRGVRVDILQQHVMELKQRSAGGGGAAPQPALPAGPSVMPTEGVAGGQEIAGAMGGIQ